MNVRIKNLLDAASEYMDDHQADMFFHSLFGGGATMLAIYRLRSMYRTGKSYYMQAAEKNALEQTKTTSASKK